MASFHLSKDDNGFALGGLSDLTCFACGRKVEAGGCWRGAKDIVVCTNTRCIETLLHVMLDAMYERGRDVAGALKINPEYPDAQRKILGDATRDTMERHREFIAMAERVFWYKEYLRARSFIYAVLPPVEEDSEIS